MFMCETIVSPAHSDSVWGVAWTRNETLDQELILSGSVDNTVRVWAWSVGGVGHE